MSLQAQVLSGISMNSRILIFAVIGIIAIVGGFVLFQQSPPPSGDGSESRMVPDLSFEDYNGNTVSLRGFIGTPIVVNSWAVWCPFCVKELADFVEVKKEFGDQIVIISIDRAESLELAKGFTDDLGVTNDLLFLLDPEDSFYRAIGGFSMPETIFVDSNGVIVFHKRGPMDADEIRERLGAIL